MENENNKMEVFLFNLKIAGVVGLMAGAIAYIFFSLGVSLLVAFFVLVFVYNDVK
jgi:hypothetical protein